MIFQDEISNLTWFQTNQIERTFMAFEYFFKHQNERFPVKYEKNVQGTLNINSCRLIKYVVFDILCTKWEKDLFRTILLVLLVIFCYITYDIQCDNPSDGQNTV